MSIENELKSLILKEGAASVGFATKESLEGGPPTTDMTYVHPDAETVICFSLPLDKDKIRPFLKKELPRGKYDHIIDNGDTYFKAYKIAKKAVKFLEGKGLKSQTVFPNFKYREDVPDWRVKWPPQLALRLIAARSGVGWFGWSGNILVKGHGANVLLGGLVTSAKLEATEPLPAEESECGKCKLCVKVCAFRMFDRTDEDTFTLGGHTMTFSKRIDVLRCNLICGGLSGLDKDRKWSTWSPGRSSYPETQDELNKLFAHLFVHPPANYSIKDEEGSFAESVLKNDSEVKEYINNCSEIAAKKIFPDNFMLTCGNCQLICWGNKEDTAENYRILTNSGCVVTNSKGENVILPAEEAEKMEQNVNLVNREETGSEESQVMEKAIYDIFTRLRKE